jgi:hypothetical protein
VRRRLLGPNQGHGAHDRCAYQRLYCALTERRRSSCFRHYDGDKEGTPALGTDREIPVYSALKKSRVRGTRQVSGRVNRETPGACVNRCPGIVGRGAIRKSATAHDRGHHFNAAVRTGWSQSAVVSVSSRLTVSEHPAMSSEVTKLPTSERLMRKPRFSSMRRAALYIK